METRIVIAGCRNYENYDEAREFIDDCICQVKKEDKIIILSGGAKGADKIGEMYAREKGYKIEKYLAKWEKYGRAAGPKRNEEMAKNCDFVVCFWDGKSKGTKSIIECAKKKNKKVWVKLIK